MLDISALSQLRDLKTNIRQSNHQFEGVVRGSSGSFGFLTLKPGQVDSSAPGGGGKGKKASKMKEAFLSPAEMLKVLPGDAVLAEISQDGKGRDVAKVISIIESSARYFTGQYVEKGKGIFIETTIEGSDRRLFIVPKKRKGAKPGDYIVARLMKHPFPDGRAQTEVLRILGNDATAGIETRLAMEVYNIRTIKLTNQPLDDATLQARFDFAAAGRTDLSSEPFFTVDGEQTLDMDDALLIERLDNDAGWRLRVAIADAAAWVEPGSELDAAAAIMGSSWYFPHKTLSMLPPVLSHKYCSLQAGKARLAVVATLNIGQNGSLIDGEEVSFERVVITSRAKVSYRQFNAVFDQNGAADGQGGTASEELPADVSEQFSEAKALASALRGWREREALLMPHRPDYRFVLGDDGKITQMQRERAGDAQQIVEECMVRTNLETARRLAGAELKAVYSAHGGFKQERLKQVRHIIREQLPALTPSDGDAPLALDTLEGYKTVMKAAQALPQDDSTSPPVFAILSRLQSRGKLSASPDAHHSMGLAQYATVTSPLRKYADLCTQRMLCSLLESNAGPVNDADVEALTAQLANGRRAVALAEKKLLARYALSLKGQHFDATVVQVNGSGFVARIESNGLEGFVDLGAIPQAKFRMDSTYFRQVGQGLSFTLNQQVAIVVGDMDDSNDRILFELSEQPSADEAELPQPPSEPESEAS